MYTRICSPFLLSTNPTSQQTLTLRNHLHVALSAILFSRARTHIEMHFLSWSPCPPPWLECMHRSNFGLCLWCHIIAFLFFGRCLGWHFLWPLHHMLLFQPRREQMPSVYQRSLSSGLLPPFLTHVLRTPSVAAELNSILFASNGGLAANGSSLLSPDFYLI